MGERPKTVLSSALSKEDGEAFDALVAGSPYGAYQQSRAWAAAVPRARRHDFLFFLAREGGEAIGAALVRRTRMAPGAALATVQRGPVVADAAKLGAVVEALKAALREEGFCTLVLGPRIMGEERAQAEAALAGLGFRLLPPKQQSLHVLTGRIALAADADEIFAGFKQRGRRWIRKLEKAGLTVRGAGAADLAGCQALLDDFRARRPDYDASGQPDAAAQAALVEALGGGMLIAEQEGRIVGLHSFVVQGREAIWLAMATDDDPQAPRSYLLVWEGVKRTRALGLDHYDVAGLSPEGAESGRDQFKNAFAPERVALLPAHVAALRPLRHAFFFTLRQAWRARKKG